MVVREEKKEKERAGGATISIFRSVDKNAAAAQPMRGH